MCEHIGHTEAKKGTLVATESGSVSFAFLDRSDTGRNAGLEGSLPLPDRCYLDRVVLAYVSGTEPASVTWWLETEDGPVTDILNSDWISGKGVTARLDLHHDRTPAAAGLTLRASADASGGVVRPILFWKVVADVDLTCEHRDRLAARKRRLGL